MAQKVVKIREDASSMSDFDEMLAMTATAAAPADEEDQDTILGEFEEQFAADADQGEDDASQAQPAGANQWPVSRAEHRLIERITHRKNARPIGRNALAAKLDQQMDNRGNRLGYKPTAYNATMILQNDERTHGALELDLFTGNVRVSRTVRLRTPGISNIHVRPDGENYWDDHESVISTWLGAPESAGGWGAVIGSERMGQAVRVAAHQNARHPIYEIITSKPWDGVHRLDSALERYLKLDPKDRAYNASVSRLAFLAAVVRLFEPGHKFDHMPVIQGLQGARKSTFIETIALGYFGEISEQRHIEDTKILNEMTSGKWVIELPELAALMGVRSSTIKSKLSSKADRARAAYSKYVEERERSFVWWGTTNQKCYLHDPSGNRRFWPLVVGVTGAQPIDLALVRSEIQQIYAEALAVYRQMRVEQPEGDLPLFLVGEADEIAKRLQGEAEVESAAKSMAGWIEHWLTRPAAPEDAEHADILVGGERYMDRFCPQQAFQAYHREMGQERPPAYDRKSQLLMGEAVQLLGCVREGKKSTYERFGRQRSFFVDREWLKAQVSERDAQRKAYETESRVQNQGPVTPWQDAVVAQMTKERQDEIAKCVANGTEPRADITPIEHHEPLDSKVVCLVNLPQKSRGSSLFDPDSVEF